MPSPLASLTDPRPGFSALRFPGDLGSKSRSHYVQFIVHRIATGEAGARSGTTLNVGPTAFQISPQTKQLGASISLYMPETVTASYQNAYQEDDLSDYTLVYYGKAAASLFDANNKFVSNTKGNFLNSITSNPNILALSRKFVGDLAPVDALLKGQGLAINPQVQLLFKATALRQFQFNFLFTPSSKQEADDIKSIITTFKYHAAPEIGGGALNNDLFFKMPDVFEIKFFNDSGENKQIHKVDECVLENIDIDYAASGGGWTAFDGGYPVQTRLTLTFKELNVIDKRKIDQGY